MELKKHDLNLFKLIIKKSLFALIPESYLFSIKRSVSNVGMFITSVPIKKLNIDIALALKSLIPYKFALWIEIYPE